MRHAGPILALALASAVACKDEPRSPPRSQQSAAQGARRLTVRDLALATAVDAKAARLSVIGTDIEAAVLAVAAKDRARAKELLPALDVARAELEQAVQAIANPADRLLAENLVALAKRYALELSGAAGAGAPGGGIVAARSELGDAIGRYRQSRGAWTLDGGAPDGAERELAESRREMEQAETALMSRTRVAPRERGHEFEPAAVRMTGRMAVLRAKAAAERLPPAMRDAGSRYAAAQERVLETVAVLSQAGEKDAARAARAYHGAKADALAALADYLAAVAAR